MAAAKQLSFCEAHKAGLCSVAYLPVAAGSGAAAVLVTAGPDGRLCYRSADKPGEVTKEVCNTNNGAATPVHCLATAQGRPVITGDEQNFVKVGAGSWQLAAGSCRWAGCDCDPLGGVVGATR